MPRSAPESETWFDDYVRSHGQDPGDPEPDLGISKNPDRLITWNGHQVVCEIKQFEANPFDRALGKVGRVATLGLGQALGSVRRKVKHAAEQLKPLQGSAWPLVIVLANPKDEPVPFSDHEIIWALYGDPVVEIPIDVENGGPAGPAEHGVGRNGRLRTRHQYVSAVVALRRRSHLEDWNKATWERLTAESPDFDPADIDAAVELLQRVDKAREAALAAGEIEEGVYLYTDVFATTSPTAVALPRDVFDGSRDRRWDYDATTGNYERTRR
jgi:hypothetical protein